MKTILGHDIPKNCRGILYLCDFDSKNLFLKVTDIRGYENSFDALQAYANIPNPESQLATGKTYEELCANLEILHRNMRDKEWLEMLAESI